MSYVLCCRDVKPENCMYGLDKATGRPLLKLGYDYLVLFSRFYVYVIV